MVVFVVADCSPLTSVFFYFNSSYFFHFSPSDSAIFVSLVCFLLPEDLRQNLLYSFDTAYAN